MTVTIKPNTVEMFHDPVLGGPRFLGRFPKPSFKYYNSTTVVVPASEKAPVYYNIGGNLYKVTADMTATIGSPAASTVYYLYATANSLSVALSILTTPPTTIAVEATYIGAFASQDSSAEVIPFTSSMGRYQVYKDFVQQAFDNTADTNKHELTLRHPVTARTSLGSALTVSMTIGTAIYYGPTNFGQAWTGRVCWNGEYNSWAEIPLVTYNKIWVAREPATSGNLYWRVMGWIEDPTEYA